MSTMAPQKYSPELRMDLMQQETSIRAALTVPQGGHVVTMGFPGLAFGVSGELYIDPERLEATLSHPALERCRLLVLLVETAELPEGAIALVGAACARRGIRLAHLPIEDYSAPGAAFAEGWAALEAPRAAALAPGGTLGLACHYGAGRSGMIAAGLLIEQGLPVAEAVAALRAQFPDSVESDLQLDWLAARAAASAAEALR
ncbi:hypothetical protein [Poseidonocella sp. HB161398]|uniref:protein-tyrosine phosphatase family protein n=1 Tax=Poseidonocella sp. HB161398 TaxID=2320855 RepID=UPI0014868146|nr:hypothetical protein [Poseidonocella sp. HB161398]